MGVVSLCTLVFVHGSSVDAVAADHVNIVNKKFDGLNIRLRSHGFPGEHQVRVFHLRLDVLLVAGLYEFVILLYYLLAILPVVAYIFNNAPHEPVFPTTIYKDPELHHLPHLWPVERENPLHDHNVSRVDRNVLFCAPTMCKIKFFNGYRLSIRQSAQGG